MRREEQTIQLARKIVELDVKRDELLEELLVLAGNQAFELLRVVQNS